MVFEMPDKSNKILVIGSDTYLGAHFTKYWLAAGYEVYGCGRATKLDESLSRAKYFTGDYSTWHFPICNYDWILLCLDPRDGLDLHLKILESLCDHLVNQGLKSHLCYPSSFAVCEGNSQRPLEEKASLTPHSELEMTIAAAELYLRMRSCRADGKLLTYILRMGEIYGDEFGFDDAPGLFNFYLRNAVRGDELPMYGLGLKRRTFTHIADACNFAIQYMKLDFPPNTMNVPGENMRIVDFLMAIACHYEVETPLASPDENNVYCNRFAGNQVLSRKLATSLINYELKYEFKAWLSQQPRPPAVALG